MDYEKKYKEALERAKTIIDGKDEWRYSDLAEIIPALTYIFPQLCESEEEKNERMRESLIALIKVIDEYFIREKIGLTREQLLDYLEKQKEPEYESYKVEREIWVEATVANSFPEQDGDFISEEDYRKILRMTADNFYEMGRKQKEQKPITESKMLANEVIEYLTKCGYSPILKDDSKKEHFHIDIPRHKDDFWHSEEYKHCRSVLGEYYMEGDYGGDTYTLYVWREKKEQKPAEWGEEDEYRIRQIERIAQEAGCTQKLQKEIHDWLKSLRSSWKPSEEHLSALLAVFNDPNNISSQTCQLALTDLYEQLKKL